MGNVLDCSTEKKEMDDEHEPASSPHHTWPSPSVVDGNIGTTTQQSRGTLPPTRGRNDKKELYPVEKDVPMRDSSLWKLQREYYELYGPECWENSVVPCFVTSNAFIASQTGRVVVAFIRDCFATWTGSDAPTQPVYIIELGCGHGKFSFLLLQALVELHDYLPELIGSDGSVRSAFVYVVTDISQKMLDYIRKHPGMQQFIEHGLLDVAFFDAEAAGVNNTPTLSLQISGTQLELESLEHPPLVLANYVLDTLQHDAFKVSSGILYENRVSINAERQVQIPLDPKDLTLKATDYLKVSWQHTPFAVPADEVSSFYRPGRGAGGDDAFNHVLAAYVTDPKVQEELGSDGSVLLPLGGLRLLKRLQKAAGGRMALLIGDKGYSTIAEMKGSVNPHVASHGSFSCMVNMDALARYVTSAGGSTVCTPYQEGFKCQLFCFGIGQDAELFPEFRLAWEDAFVVFGPESFTTLQRAVKDEVQEPSIRHILSILRLSCCDPDVFLKFKTPLLRHIAATDLPPSAWADVRRDMELVAGNSYRVAPTKDVAFEVARVLMAMKDFEGAQTLFQISQESFGQHHVTSHNLAMCYFYRGDFQKAKENFSQALEAEPSYTDAKDWLEHCTRAEQETLEAASTSINIETDKDVSSNGDTFLQQTHNQEQHIHPQTSQTNGNTSPRQSPSPSRSSSDARIPRQSSSMQSIAI